jgi:hypothetical protein
MDDRLIEEVQYGAFQLNFSNTKGEKIYAEMNKGLKLVYLQ